MLLRPRQELFVERALAALGERGNTLGVAPTGSGKTCCMSAIVGQWHQRQGVERSLILQHRDELIDQNLKTFRAVNPRLLPGLVTADIKDFKKPVTFAMVQTLARNLGKMRPLNMLAIDEAHHVAAKSYRAIVDKARELNPDVAVLGVTATSNRGDKKALRSVFDNCADQIALGEAIKLGWLVRPRTFVIDLGVQEELSYVRRAVSDFDMGEVEKIMDKTVLNEAVVEKWKEHAGDRQTVVFCSTVEHARHVVEAFHAANITVHLVSGEMPDLERQRAIKAFDRREFQVMVNVFVLTEGWDCQPVDCVVLLRPSSYKSTMIQMIGRGLRRVDPERYPGVVKSDCIVLDFGTSVLMHGSLEDQVDLEPQKGEAPKKTCPQCTASVPVGVGECPICGFDFQMAREPAGKKEREALTDGFTLIEIDLFNQSPFRWESLWDGVVLVACGLDAWAMTIWYMGQWHAIGGAKEQGTHYLAVGDKLLCLAQSDDFLRLHGDKRMAAKTKAWLHEMATEKQAKYLGPAAQSMTRYEATCYLTWKFNEKAVRTKLERAAMGVAA